MTLRWPIPVPREVREALRALGEAMRDPGPDPSARADDGYDPLFVERTAPLLEFLYHRWFRISLEGIEHLPESGAALLAANHSGGLPYDGAMLMHGVRRQHPRHRRLRALVAEFAFASSWMRGVVSRFGGVRATGTAAAALLAQGELLAVFPEGLRGVGKTFRERYRLDHFGRGGFVRLARRARVPVIPVAIVGAEEIHPLLGKLTRLPGLVGIPYLPITPTFPWLGPLGLLPLPTKWTIRFAPPLIVPPEGDDRQGATLEIAERVRAQVDAMIADVLSNRRSVLFG